MDFGIAPASTVGRESQSMIAKTFLVCKLPISFGKLWTTSRTHGIRAGGHTTGSGSINKAALFHKYTGSLRGTNG
ncbi:hypothetical protein I7I50_02662 [Histoplasma capsulatum G186AR]|uniref:Uncharacterized protein n=1 Tax=Ajellomyces capsulatus TaxID=5037 RepID=A0A8H7Z285_AJECA|nr:hypothetical protein I7I52_00673 [Histoplasma capsulatum]QSS71711.1 hypothetical protein I7I50_02662 [Histoplasma capsulatum G186AR]